MVCLVCAYVFYVCTQAHTEAWKLGVDMSVIISALSVLRWDFSLTLELAVFDGLVCQRTLPTPPQPVLG